MGKLIEQTFTFNTRFGDYETTIKEVVTSDQEPFVSFRGLAIFTAIDSFVGEDRFIWLLVEMQVAAELIQEFGQEKGKEVYHEYELDRNVLIDHDFLQIMEEFSALVNGEIGLDELSIAEQAYDLTNEEGSRYFNFRLLLAKQNIIQLSRKLWPWKLK